MSPAALLLLNLALAFYATGAIWAHGADIFRSWTLVNSEAFQRLQLAHWRKLPYWVFVPVGFMFIGSIVLIWYHPTGSPRWGIWGSFACQLASHALTAVMWGPWAGETQYR